MEDLSPEALARCESALAFIEDMSAWYDEEIEDKPRSEYIHEVLAQIVRRGSLSPDETAWVESRLRERY